MRGARDKVAGHWHRGLRAVLVDALLGAAVATGQAPWGLWPLSLLALSIIFWRIAAARTAASCGWRALGAGMGYFALAMSWIVEPFFVQPEIYGWMAPFALLFMALGGGLFWSVPGWIAGRIAGHGNAIVVAFAAGLVLSDWLRGWIFTGLPWALLGHIWIDTPVAQSAAYAGAIGLTALTVAVAALPVIFRRNGTAAALSLWPGTALSVLLVATLWVGGLKRLDTPIVETGVTLRLVQPNAEQALKWDPEWAQIFWQRLLQESAAPADGPAPDAVIWPETAVSFPLNVAGEALPVLSEAAGTTVLMGIQRDEDARYYNSFIEVAPGGEVRQIYDKFHLVPFGEYIPWGDQMARIGIRAFAAQLGFGYSAGSGPAVMQSEGLPPFQPLICYEAIFPQHLRSVEGAEWLLQATNDAWFGTLSGPYQHLAQARLRAIESGMPLMRAANTGITASIDPLGRITASLPLGVVGHIDAPLPAALPRTIWMKFGPLPIVIISILLIVVAGFHRRPHLKLGDNTAHHECKKRRRCKATPFILRSAAAGSPIGLQCKILT
ncbi:apolipoprotein N-acyltransferase [Paracoccus albus]|uniref:apolipoprotein N-acyltransferase n=1 Tax=Paracoccus albus TaxID=3017784 RepID=UPI0022F1045F|nr:apolipoprotein N-acyltransferase [Paracoccus albus]WBU58927.1 apolipoprotein N-acyltransferase [Paracoccus albus]